MENRSKKTILIFFALGLIICGLCVQQARAVSIHGVLAFSGGAEMDTGTVDTATMVTNWVSAHVDGTSGDFVPFVTVNDSMTFSAPWSFNSGPINLFWSVDGFTFDLNASSIGFQGFGNLFVTGTGWVSGNGFAPTSATFSFTSQDPSSDGVFSWSGGVEAIPDGGTTVALLGLALAGIEGIRRKLRSVKS
jgi:hypothetical protein